jgi:asparagine synthase (glutamine-hydrolysing)
MLGEHRSVEMGGRIVSVMFGRWNFDGKPAAPKYLDAAREILSPYASDGCSSYSSKDVSILYHPFHTTKESHCETQPLVTRSGAVISWDGRLDNREELFAQLKESPQHGCADVSIVAIAYDRWGAECFEKLIGDWALSVWNPNERSVTLAKDPIGPRHLYYTLEENQVAWSTILDPLVLLTGKTFTLDEEYIAGWFSFFPATHLTPYVGIHSVPPSSLVRIQPGRQTTTQFWRFDPAKKTSCRNDADYEEHFRAVFAKSVGRRLRSDTPILAELSGGVDSSAIVCVADQLFARGLAEAPELDTLSYYDDSEPNWDERPYFTLIEEKLKRTGYHIDVGSQNMFQFAFAGDRLATTPGSYVRSIGVRNQFRDCVNTQGNRVLLSGTGGDETTGGVPTPIPELADLMAGAQLETLTHRLKVWALHKRKPWFHLLFEAARGFFPIALFGLPRQMRPAPWLHPKFVERNRTALVGYPSRFKVFGPPPSFQENLSTLLALQRQLACIAVPSNPSYELRYPYLDRDLLEFLYAVPREQLVRPGHRRSLMRRSLTGIVPDQVLNRKRKAFVSRAPIMAISAEWTSLLETSQNMVTSSIGIVDAKRLLATLEDAHRGREVPIVPLLRTLNIEFWLRGLWESKVWSHAMCR